MTTTRERLENLFTLTNKAEIAKEIIDIIDDAVVSSIGVRLEKEYTFEDEQGNYLAGTCYTSAPRKGDFITIGKNMYEIIKVIHCYEDNASGTIILKKS